jgi:hypothetical protein
MRDDPSATGPGGQGFVPRPADGLRAVARHLERRLGIWKGARRIPNIAMYVTKLAMTLRERQLIIRSWNAVPPIRHETETSR